MNKKQNINYLRRFQEVVIYLTLVNMKNNFNSLDDYYNESVGNKALKLHITEQIIKKISKYHLKEFIAESTHLFKYHKHCHVKFASGKKFTRNSWFELNSHLLDSQNLTSLANCCLDSMSADSRKWIEKHFFKTKQRKKNNMKIEDIKYETIKTNINSIKRIKRTNKSTSKNYYVIVIITKDGIFSNYQHIWDKQNIDVEKLTSSDLVEITYVKKNEKYSNFVNIKVLNKISIENIDEIDSDINEDGFLPF